MSEVKQRKEKTQKRQETAAVLGADLKDHGFSQPHHIILGSLSWVIVTSWGAAPKTAYEKRREGIDRKSVV